MRAGSLNGQPARCALTSELSSCHFAAPQNSKSRSSAVMPSARAAQLTVCSLAGSATDRSGGADSGQLTR